MIWFLFYFSTSKQPLLRSSYHILTSCSLSIASSIHPIFGKISLLYIFQHYFFEFWYTYKHKKEISLLLHHGTVLGLILGSVNFCNSLTNPMLVALINCSLELPNLGLNWVRMSKFPEIYSNWLPQKLNRRLLQIIASWGFIVNRGCIGLPLLTFLVIQSVCYSETSFLQKIVLIGSWGCQIFYNCRWIGKLIHVFQHFP